MKYRHLIFDLDGTLSDSKAGIVRSIRYALKELDRPLDDGLDLDWCVGPPIGQVMERLLNDGDRDLAAKAVRLFRARYRNRGYLENVLYPGVPEILSRLAASGRELFVGTSKLVETAKRVIDHFRLDPYFKRVYGAVPGGGLDDKAELIGHILAEEGLDPAKTVMIGDREHDVSAAKANGLAAVGVTYGYGGREELIRASADALCEEPAQLPSLV